jgi:hypothetical protein
MVIGWFRSEAVIRKLKFGDSVQDIMSAIGEFSESPFYGRVIKTKFIFKDLESASTDGNWYL